MRARVAPCDAMADHYSTRAKGGPLTWAIWAGPKMPAATLIEIPDETAPTTPSTPAISSSSALCPAIVASKLEKTRDLPLVGQ